MWVERSTLALQADRLDDAQQAIETALRLDPAYRPALQVAAQLLVLQGKRDQAEALLASHATTLQAPYLLVQLSQIRNELGMLAPAMDALVTAVGMMPRPETDAIRDLAGIASDLHFKLGNYDAAASLARFIGTPLLTRLADRIQSGAPARRLLLDVPYVRQDHKTCAPATLTSLCHFHGRPADHVAIVEEICYDGTPAANERHWAEQHGFAVQFFTATWDSAVALLDRGLPFALLTVAADSAHLQAIVGYDLLRATLLVRDPSVPAIVELDAAGLFETQKFSGPRGMVLVPAERGAELDAVPLPDAALHDHLYRLQRALLRHDRPAAAAELAALEVAASSSVITAQARRALASYDDNPAAMLLAYDRLLALQPDAAMPLVGKLSCLTGLAREDERRQQLRAAADREGADPIFGRLWAEELARDARTADDAELWLASAARRRPQDASAYSLLAQVASLRGNLTEAWRLHRFAACLDDMNEWPAEQYFRLARAVGLREPALQFLRSRVDRWGRRSSFPWQTLFGALQSLDRAQEAQEVLTAALVARPDDGELALFAARAALRSGQIDQARAFLTNARGKVKQTAWLVAAAQLDAASGERTAAIERMSAILRLEPLSLDAHTGLAQLLVETTGRDAACAHLAAAVAAHPHHTRLARLLVDFTPDEGEEGLRVVRRVTELAPTDTWARRELALRLARRHRPDEAAVEAELAARLEPDSASTHGINGVVLAAVGRKEPARESFRKALAQSADYVFAFNSLVDLADDAADRLRAIRWLQQELRRQVVFGEGLSALRVAARGLLPDQEIVDFLEEARRARPDLLGCWMALVDQRMAMTELDRARQIAGEAAAHFPMVTDPLVALALVEERRGDDAARRVALDRCLALDPGHAFATRALADVMEKEGDAEGALRLLEKAIERSPLDIGHRAAMAKRKARDGDIDGAFATVRHLLELDPACDWGWERLAEWGDLHGARDKAWQVADAVTQARPHAGAAHLGRAGLLMGSPGHLDDALAALDQALLCEPRLMEAHDIRAVLLVRLGRFDAALAACRPPVFGDAPPLPLRGRRAWVWKQMNETSKAVREMEAVVSDHPQYVFGLAQLGAWYQDDGLLHAARRSFEKLLAIDGSHTDAALGLFDVCLEQNDLEACAQALARLDAREPSPFALARQVQLLCARGESDRALAVLHQLLRTPMAGTWPILTATNVLSRCGRQRAAFLTLDEAVTVTATTEVSTTLGDAWGQVATEVPLPIVIARVRKLMAGSSVMQAAVATYLETLADRGKKRTLWLLCCLFHRAFRRSDRVWGAVGYLLVTLGNYRLAIRWMRDHLRRRDARPWMLNNLALALRERRRDTEANAVGRRALELRPDHATDMHRRWLAWDAAVAGDGGEARKHLERGLAAGGDLGSFLEAHARALLLALPAGPDGTADPVEDDAVKQAQAQARALLEKAVSDYPGQAGSRIGRRVAALTRARLWMGS